MTIKSIAIKNMLRRKGKTVLVLSGLVIGVATVIAIVSYVDTMTADINAQLEKFGANILIVPRTDNLTLSYGNLTLGGVSYDMQEIQQAALNQILTIKNAANIAAIGPVVLGGVKINDRRIMLAGVDFAVAGILKPWWKIKGVFPQNDQVMLGTEVARVLNVAPGETLALSGRPMQIAGILQPTGSQDDQLIFADLATAQHMLAKSGTVSMVEVAALCHACPVTDMVAQISEVLPMAKVMAIQQVVQSRMQTLAQFKTFALGISVVIILIGSMVVLVTMMGSVQERRREIGIFRAIGFRKRHIMRIIFIEAGSIGLVAGILGYGIGILAASGGLKLLGKGPFGWLVPEPLMLIHAVLGSVVIGMAASIYPAVMASRLDPNESLHAL